MKQFYRVIGDAGDYVDPSDEKVHQIPLGAEFVVEFTLRLPDGRELEYVMDAYDWTNVQDGLIYDWEKES